MTSVITPATAEQVLNFWFVEHGPSDWFGKNPAFDELISQRFLAVYEQLATGVSADDMHDAETALAAILVLDQFPRNLFRDSPQAFATDPQALELARQAVNRGLDQQLRTEQRVFMYMPFEHSENIADQDRSCELFAELGNDYYSDYARRHRDVIRCFGRFPHRNAILGRRNTAAEADYLAMPGSGF